MVQRYVATEDRQFKQLNNGPFVLYSDHAALEQRCRELEVENKYLKRILNLDKPIDPIVAMRVMKEMEGK